MNNKWMTIAICFAVVLIGTVGMTCVSDDVDAVEGGIIEVSTGEQLVDAMQNRYEKTDYNGSDSNYNYTVTVAPVTISITEDIVLDDDSGLIYDPSLGGYCATPYFSGTINGNGHTISTNFSHGWYYLAEYTTGQTTIKNLNIECEGGVFSLIMGAGVLKDTFYDGETVVTFENVILKKYVEADSNDSAFAVHAYNCTVNFVDCVNDADYNMKNYAGVFLGGMAVGDVTANFSGCVNNGDITGNKTYLFIGNPSKNISLKVSVDSDCKNNGSLTGDKAALFADFGSSTFFAEANSLYADRTDLTDNIHLTTGMGITADYEAGTNKIIISGGDSSNTYQVSMLVYATILGDAGTINMTLTLPITDAGVYAGWFLDKNTAMQSYGLDVSGDYTPIENTAYSYKTVKMDDGQTIYIVDLGIASASYTMCSNPTVRITGFDDDGNRLGSIQMPSISTALPERIVTYLVTFSPGMYSYNIISDGQNVVKDGDSFEFSIQPTSGYNVLRVLYNGAEVEGLNGRYTIENITTNLTIRVETERISYDVVADLENATISNLSTSVTMGQGYEATITALDGYEIASITLIMGGTEIPVIGNTIRIPEVTGNLVITVKTTPVEEEPEIPLYPPMFDDDYIPIPPTGDDETSSDDSSVETVACAAAAVVAALLAAFIIIDRRR